MGKDNNLNFGEILKKNISKNGDSEKTSREKVDETIDGIGEEALQKMGVPKGLSKVAIKTNGGIFSPNNTPAARIAKNKSRNALAKGYDKASSGKEAFEKKLGNKNFYKNKSKELEENKNKLTDDLNKNKDRQDFAKEKLEAAKQNAKNNKNAESKTGLKEAKKENRDAKKEGKNQKKQLNQVKKDQKNVKKDSRKANMHKFMHPGDAAKTAVNKLLKAIKIKLMLILGSIALGIFCAVFIIYLILGPLMEVFNNIDESITKAANFQEKLDNFYKGFGFNDSESAFYKEVDELYKTYGPELDIPLILATIFYTENFGYDTNYDEIEESDIEDPTLIGDNSNLLSTIRSYFCEKFDESVETIGEDGLTYNAGRLYRLRKLARNQFYTDKFGLNSKKGKEVTVTLGEFLDDYGDRIADSLLDYWSSLVGCVVTSFEALFKEIWAFVVGSDYRGTFFENGWHATSDLIDAFRNLIGNMFYGIADITDVSFEVASKSDDSGEIEFFNIFITHRTYEFDKDNYDKYLMEYYLEYMPEFQKILPKDSDKREEEKQKIINDIYITKEAFEELFLERISASSEVYAEDYVGGIDPVLVNELGLPVTVPEGTTISFTNGETAYGIRDGVNHNGVDLNSATAGVNEGDPVYAIASGKVVDSLPDVSCNTRSDSNCQYSQGAWVRIEHNVVVDNKEYKFYSVYMHLQANSGQPEVGTNVAKGDVIGKIGNTGDSSGAHLHFEFREIDGSANGKAIDPTNLFIPPSSSVLAGSDDKEKIWNYFISKGYPKNGVAGMMGNIQEESGFISTRVQADYLQTDPSGYRNEYTAKVDNGTVSRYDFANNGPGGGGYGLVQWTYYTRKEGLYDYAKSLNVSIGDLGMQLDYLDNELKTSYPGVYETVTSVGVTIDSATRKFMLEFESPYDQSEGAQQGRIKNSQSVYDLYGN